MERVRTLIEKLLSQSEKKDSASAMLHTIQMLQAELMAEIGMNATRHTSKVSVIVPMHYPMQSKFPEERAAVNNDKIVQVLQVNEQEVEEELARIKKHAETVNALGRQARPDDHFQAMEDIPTLAHQDPLPKEGKIVREKVGDLPEFSEYPESLNDKLKQAKTELSDAINTAPIKDLRKAINVNDRFIFVNELFRGDEAMYERSMKTIQNFSIYAEAEFWIKRELKIKIGWLENDPLVRQFDELVRRRFV